MDYEIVNIRPLTPEEQIQMAEFVINESPWITVHDGITGAYFQYHRETKERREVPADWWK